MEVDDIQTQPQPQPQQQQKQQQQPQPQPQPPSKYSRVSSNGGTHNELVVVGPSENSTKSRRATTSGGGGGGGGGGLMGELMVGNSSNSRFGRQWQHSSRIIRVSRASGGKDRHSKVWTAKGPRDRRVRLSVTTAIQFYDLQDRLGYDQPSKAVEWLIKAASDAINELPGLNTESFPPPETPPPSRKLSGGDERKIDGGGVLDSMVDDLGVNHQQDHPDHQQRQQQQIGSKSGCSSNNSETSKGSGGLSLSRKRSEIRVKARERARERTNNNMAQTSSFTQLLTAGMNHSNTNNKHSSTVANEDNNKNNNSNNSNQWLSSGSSAAGQMADYFGTGLIGVGNNNNTSVMTTITSFGSENHHQQLQQQQQQQPHFPFLSDQHLIQVANGANNSGNGGGGGDYNLNFSISSTSNTSTSGYNNSRGTLQSNSPSLLPYLQRFSAATDGSSLPFFLGNAAVSSDHQHQFQPPGLQLCYGDPGRRQSSDHKGKGKN